MQTEVVKVEIPEGCNVIIGSSHFIKTVEDLYEAMTGSVPGGKFGIGFGEASGPCLVRHDGTDEELRNLASSTMLRLGCGHTFIIYMRNMYPINVLNAVKNVQEVCTIHAATANPLEVLVAETEQGRGIIGVIDGFKLKGIEMEEDITKRRQFLRTIGYKR